MQPNIQKQSQGIRHQIRLSNARGHADHGWLQARHSFSFASYYDTQHMGWGNLRVINEDRIAAHRGFATHGHDNMEIITYVLSGAIQHKDSMGNAGIIQAGEMQHMSAGTGVQHSEINPTDEQTHLLQIWIVPNQHNVAPSYAQSALDFAESENTLIPVAAPVADSTSNAPLKIHADAYLFAARCSTEQTLHYQPRYGKTYVQVIGGAVQYDDTTAKAGDALLLDCTDAESPTALPVIDIHAPAGAHFLLFDVSDMPR